MIVMMTTPFGSLQNEMNKRNCNELFVKQSLCGSCSHNTKKNEVSMDSSLPSQLGYHRTTASKNSVPGELYHGKIGFCRYHCFKTLPYDSELYCNFCILVMVIYFCNSNHVLAVNWNV